MSNRLLPPRESEEALKCIQRHSLGVARDTLFKEFGRAWGFRTVKSFSDSLRDTWELRRPVPASEKHKWDDPPKLHGDILILCDLQIPFHDADFINKCMDLAYAWGILKGIAAGDMMDMTAFSIFATKPEDTWADERDMAEQIMQAMTDSVPEWLMLAGNHEYFLIKRLAEQFDMKDVLRLLDKPKGFTASDYYFCIANGDWRISHPRNVSVIHGRVAQRLATKLSMNVASGHGHLWGHVLSEGGKYDAIDIGVCCEPTALDYASQRDTLRPAMNKGDLILKKVDGKTIPYTLRPGMDWDAMRHLYQRG